MPRLFVQRRGRNAPYDDAPVTDEERTAVQEGLDAIEGGDVYTMDEVEKELGL